MDVSSSWLLPLIFYTIMLWLYRFSQGQNVLGKPRPGVSDEWRLTHGRTMRRTIIIIVAVYTALLLLQLR
ncbi:hypothetical protein [Hymenobacter metallicola]|uniref:Uncharacterized protein n=1 Tax=Hymenobacter metallicola TaxID=2563114 RepID=A0A4Z0QD99_9BACT|nr:hypothetical protein [Hymenobacter metallicola]TGE26682.1 hypothetical protein E5K02_18060 [Hymenobacter metallicola]